MPQARVVVLPTVPVGRLEGSQEDGSDGSGPRLA